MKAFFSTDGKHSVEAENVGELEDAIKLYKRILQEFGTKQAQAVKEYAKNGNGETKDCPECKSKMTFKTGFSEKTNKKWNGWFCQNESCKHVDWGK